MTAPTLPDVPAVKHCGEPTETGEPCRQVVGIHSASGRCIWHDPERATEATEARLRGNVSASRREPQSTDVPPPPSPTTLQGVCDWLSWVTGALARGQVDKAVATGCTYALQNLKGALSMRDLEARYTALEAKVEAIQRRST